MRSWFFPIGRHVSRMLRRPSKYREDGIISFSKRSKTKNIRLLFFPREKHCSGPVRISRKQFFFKIFFREILTSEYFWVPVSFSYGYHPLLFVHGQNFLPSAKGQKTILREWHLFLSNGKDFLREVLTVRKELFGPQS